MQIDDEKGTCNMSPKEKVFELLSNEGCGVLPKDEISDNSFLFDIGIDSIRFMELVVLLEEYFETSLPDSLLEVTSKTKVIEILTILESVNERNL
ncbi:acyl carrier protein [Cytobacillus pseudoceanisediminis]|uniref:acyl carrier protein n=1 Tax=Cytobacillus pseudoceanisediminis TaxID=3051614 RepID=UPI003C2E013A